MQGAEEGSRSPFYAHATIFDTRVVWVLPPFHSLSAATHISLLLLHMVGAHA